jgi:hypothetical protein
MAAGTTVMRAAQAAGDELPEDAASVVALLMERVDELEAALTELLAAIKGVAGVGVYRRSPHAVAIARRVLTERGEYVD